MEHGWFDMAALAEYMRGLVDGGPTRSGHRTPAIIGEAPVNGKVLAACKRNGIAFQEGCSRENIISRLDEGVRVIAGHDPEVARIGREHRKRAMPV